MNWVNWKTVYSDGQENEQLKALLTKKTAQFNELWECYEDLQMKYIEVMKVRTNHQERNSYRDKIHNAKEDIEKFDELV